MKQRPIVLAVTAAFLILAAWLALRPGHPPVVPVDAGATAQPTPAITQTGEVIPSTLHPLGGTNSPAPAVVSATPAALAGQTPVPAPGARTGPNTANPGNPPADGAAAGPLTRERAMAEVAKVRQMIGDYHTLMGENPVGTNAEIMHALMGGNSHQAMLGPPEGQQLNGQGELVDPWGTPYFFHQLSRDHMEIRSAGPDKVMGTDDDVMLK